MGKNNSNVVTAKEFAKHFGTHEDSFNEGTLDLIDHLDFSYSEIIEKERDDIILNILKHIEEDKQKIAGKGRTEAWQRGWEENYEAFIKSNCDLETLIPKFLRPNQSIRLNRRFINPNNTNFEYDFFRVFRYWLFTKYFTDIDNIYEFGCGTGMNLVELATIFPEKNLYGSDFVDSAISLVNKIAQVYKYKLLGSIFNMMEPNYEYKIVPNSGVYTFGALEQLASKTENMLQYLLKEKPKLIIHLEPTIELYDENNLIDYLAIKFHKKRGYSQGYLPRLHQLEQDGLLKIEKVKRLEFGSLFLEGYNLIVWRPI